MNGGRQGGNNLYAGRRQFVGSLLGLGVSVALKGKGLGLCQTAAASETSLPASLTLVQFGADPTGKRDSSDALIQAVKAASRTKVPIVAKESDVYRIDSNVNLYESDVIIDLKNALVTGHGTIVFDGDSGIDGNWSKAIRNVHVRNVRFGNGRGSQTKAVRFLYCVDSSMSNVTRHSYGDTGVEMFFCKRTVFSNVTSHGGKDQASHASQGAIAALMLHCEDCTFDSVKAIEGPFITGIQVKGGSGNKVMNCSISNVVSGRFVKVMRYGFYNRGDAPWSASPTPGLQRHGYSYPYAGGAWSSPDPGRATVGTKYVDCVVENCEKVWNAYQAEQFSGGSMEKCRALNNHGGSSFAVNGTIDGKESEFTISNCESVGATNFGICVIGSRRALAPLSGISLIGNIVRNSGYCGIYVTDTVDLVASGNVVVDSCLRPSRQYGSAVLVRNSRNATVEKSRLENTRGCSGGALSLSVGGNNVGMRINNNIGLDGSGASCKITN